MKSAMDDTPMVQIDRKSSIENEPRTLNIQQLQIAREAALYVMSTRSVEDALRIFTEGLQPVLRCGRNNGGTMMDYGEEIEGPINQLRIPECRDIASAPFNTFVK